MKTNLRWLSLLITCALAGVVVGCGSTSSDSDVTTCTDDTGCEGGESCVFSSSTAAIGTCNPAEANNTPVPTPGLFSSSKVDILWVIDDSGSMCEEQAQLRDNVDVLIDALVNAGADFRLAVVTTDMAAPDEAGRFQNIPEGVTGMTCAVDVDLSACPGVLSTGPGNPANIDVAALPPRVIDSTDPRYLLENGEVDRERLSLEFGCSATTGTRGSGFEMGLEAARTALSPALLAEANRGFLREDAYLAIVFLTDENDCSDGDALQKTNGHVCEWERDKLVPEQEYIDALKDLKGSEEQLILAGILAPDSGLRYDSPSEVLPSCTSSLGTGYAGYRYQSVITSFTSNNISNICSEGAFAAALETLGQLITGVVQR